MQICTSILHFHYFKHKYSNIKFNEAQKTAMLHMESFVDFCLTRAVYEIVLVNTIALENKLLLKELISPCLSKLRYW